MFVFLVVNCTATKNKAVDMDRYVPSSSTYVSFPATASVIRPHGLRPNNPALCHGLKEPCDLRAFVMYDVSCIMWRSPQNHRMIMLMGVASPVLAEPPGESNSSQPLTVAWLFGRSGRRPRPDSDVPPRLGQSERE